jgi:hypothetical protein
MPSSDLCKSRLSVGGGQQGRHTTFAWLKSCLVCQVFQICITGGWVIDVEEEHALLSEYVGTSAADVRHCRSPMHKSSCEDLPPLDLRSSVTTMGWACFGQFFQVIRGQIACLKVCNSKCLASLLARK